VGFLGDVRRMKVALMRAGASSWWWATAAGFFEHAQATGAWRSAWER
jgi:hypothetical protein